MRLIVAEAIVVGGMLPGYQELARRCGVATNTVQRAIANLAERGIVRRENRRGTFLARTVDPLIDAHSLPAAGRFSRVETERPQAPARRLSIGVIACIPSTDRAFLESSWHYSIVSGIERAAAAESRVTVQFVNRWRPGQEGLCAEDVLALVLESRVDGLILVLQDECVWGAAQMASFRGVPVVSISGTPAQLPLAQVYYEEGLAGYRAACHAVELGYRRILFASPYDDHWVRHRLEGVAKAVADSRRKVEIVAEVDSVHPASVGDYKEAGYRLGQAMAPRLAPDTAVIAIGDSVAYGIAAAAGELGHLMGRDFGLIGFDDRPESREIGLTSLRPPLQEMGREALRMVVQTARTRDAPNQVRLASSLIPRISTRAVGE